MGIVLISRTGQQAPPPPLIGHVFGLWRYFIALGLLKSSDGACLTEANLEDTL